MIKRWYQFIKENVSDVNSINYPIKEYEFEDIFLSLIDNHYTIDYVNYGFYRVDRGERFTNEITGTIKPCIQIRIGSSSETPNIDLTNEFKKSVSKINNKCQRIPGELFPRDYSMSEIKMEVYNEYTGHSMNMENIIVKGGFKGKNGTTVFNTVVIDIIIGNDSFEATPIMAIKYYRIKDEPKGSLVFVDNTPYYDILYTDLVDKLVPNKNRYKPYLMHEDSLEVIIDHRQDTSSILNALNDDVIKKYIKTIIKDGMFDDMVSEFNRNSNRVNIDSDLSEDEKINLLMKDQSKLADAIDYVIDEGDENDTLYKMKDVYRDMEERSLVDNQYKALEDDFERRVRDDYTGKCKMMTKKVQGQDLCYYRFIIEMDWFEYFNDVDEIFDKEAVDLFEHHISDNYIDLNPDFPDYGGVNWVNYNNECEKIIDEYLND